MQDVTPALWQGLTRLLAVYDGSNSLIMRFEYADGRMPVAMTRGGATYYLTYDQVGSLRVVADSAGNVVKRTDYDSFGNIIDDTNPSFDMPFGFAGGLHDLDTGLVRFGYRDYDPDIGRWTAKDPILFAGGDTDLFGYCLNDPVNAIDPWGLCARDPDFSDLKPGADSSSGPMAFYVAGASLAGTGATLVWYGAGMIAVGGPAGWVGGGIVVIVGTAMTVSGVGAGYLGWQTR